MKTDTNFDSFYDPMYELTDEQRDTYPKFLARYWGRAFTDCVFIRCDGPHHSAGIKADGSIAWEHHDDGFEGQTRYRTARMQISPLLAAAMLIHHREAK